MFVYLYGGHLGISPPAEALKLQRIVTKPHWTSIHGGAFLHFKLHMVQVWEIMIRPRSKQTHRVMTEPHTNCTLLHLYVLFPVTHWLHLGPSTLGLHRHRPCLALHACPTEPPMSHWQPRCTGARV